MTRALILIDIQQGFNDPMWGGRNNPAAEENVARLLAHWREQGLPIFHIQHLSITPRSPLNPQGGAIAFKSDVAPLLDETVIQKYANSAFIGTNLEAQLRAGCITGLVIFGLTTPHCVPTTTRMAANFGVNVTLAHDAYAAVVLGIDTSWRDNGSLSPKFIHQAALDHLNGEFATVLATNDILP